MAFPADVADRLRHGESDRFLSALFAPPPARPALLALYALDSEFKRISTIVSEPMLGAIRFQWWRDTIGSVMQGEHPGHEIVPALALAIRHGDLPPEAFHAWTDAREQELDAAPFGSLDDMEAAARAADGTIVDLAARVLTGGSLDPAATAAGTAYGLAAMLRRLPHAASHGTCVLPADDLAATGASVEDVLRGRAVPGVRDTIGRVTGRIAALLRDLPARPADKAALPAFMPASLVAGYLKRLSRPDADPFRHRAEIPAFRRQITLLARAMSGRI